MFMDYHFLFEIAVILLSNPIVKKSLGTEKGSYVP